MREARARQEQEARRAAEEEHRRQAETHAREQAEQEAADRYWAALTQQEQSRLDAEALQAFPLDDRILNSPLRRTFLRSIRAQYLRQLLSTREATQPSFSADPEKVWPE
jgi:hypothetical protein